MTNIQKAGSLVGSLLLISLIFYFTVERPRTIGKGFTAAAPIPVAAKLPTETVSLPKGIKAVKPEAVKKLKFSLRTDQHLTATAILPKSKGGYSVLSVTDDSGDTTILTEENPPALFSLDNSGRVGIGIGVSTQRGQSAKVFAEYSPITLLGATLGVEAQVSYHPTEITAPVELYGGVILFKQF